MTKRKDILHWVPSDTIGLSVNSGEELGEWILNAESEIIRLRADLLWISKTCRQEIPLGYSETMRKVLLRHLAERAEKALK